VAGNDSVAGSDSTGSDSAAGNGDVTVPLLQCPELVTLPSQQGSVFAALKAHLRIRTWLLNCTKLCPLSSSQDSTVEEGLLVVFDIPCQRDQLRISCLRRRKEENSSQYSILVLCLSCDIVG